MAFLRITGDEVFPGTVDVLIRVIEESEDTIQAFSGFMRTLDDDLAHFEPLAVFTYKGRKAKEIYTAAKANDKSGYQDVRTVTITDDVRRLIVSWTFKAEESQVIE